MTNRAAKKAEREAYKARHLDLMRQARAIVIKGVCPLCGTALYRNNSLSGWYQCGHVGAPGFQREASEKHCSFDIFYDPSTEERAIIEAEVLHKTIFGEGSAQ